MFIRRLPGFFLGCPPGERDCRWYRVGPGVEAIDVPCDDVYCRRKLFLLVLASHTQLSLDTVTAFYTLTRPHGPPVSADPVSRFFPVSPGVPVNGVREVFVDDVQSWSWSRSVCQSSRADGDRQTFHEGKVLGGCVES